MALMREPMVMYDGGFEAEVDAAVLFDLGGYGYAPDEPYVPDGTSWAGAGPSVLTFDRPAEAPVIVADEQADCDAMNEDQAASSTIGFDPASACFSLTRRPGGARRLLLPSTSNGTGSQDVPAPARVSTQKQRPYPVRMQDASKRQCGVSRKRSNPKPSAPTTTPPKLAAKKRREKISERLRTLQELVPNGTKVDMVTMLDKAISYVKFLQLQVKVLATDEFWPAQGVMAPEISRVKEALDAILVSPQRGQLN